MKNKLLFCDVKIGEEMPRIATYVKSRQLVMWAGASEDYMEIHYDKDYAFANGLKEPIVHGALKTAMLSQYVKSWLGDSAILKYFKCKYIGIDYVNTKITLKGEVKRKFINGDKHIIECQVWTESELGEVTTTAIARLEYSQ